MVAVFSPDQSMRTFREIYPVSCSCLEPGLRDRVAGNSAPDTDVAAFIGFVQNEAGEAALPPYLHDLARIEAEMYRFGMIERPESDREPAGHEINPRLSLLVLSWKGLAAFIRDKRHAPESGEETVLVYRNPRTDETIARRAADEDLAALKIVAEHIDPMQAASAGSTSAAFIYGLLDQAVSRGVLLGPRSSIRRQHPVVATDFVRDERFFVSEGFTLQWHITQACDLHCRHCYDRSQRKQTTFEQGITLLDDLQEFCRKKNVRGRVSFSGGNPLLHEHFHDFYRAARDRGFSLAILGNPAGRKEMEKILAIQTPEFYQVSLEGLEEHNDHIRGEGHFRRTLSFLELLKTMNISSMVMLTLTRQNMDQVLPLAELLEGRVDDFHFNRLSLVGEGARLAVAPAEDFARFLEAYLEAAGKSSMMGLKDNLINLIRYRKGQQPFGGCTGFGCGAAFNFISVLPDGEAHACRKFPSLIGNVFTEGMQGVYDSDAAHRYRSGCGACSGCPIRPVCGGCLASSYSHGIDIYREKDPFCFHEFQDQDDGNTCNAA